jgi:transcriptional regulator with XRE-family HTH domain
MSTDAGTPNTRLRQQRMKRGWSQKRLADMLDTSKEVVSRWERGIQHPSPYYQEKLCTIFGQTAEELGFFAPISRNISLAPELESSLLSEEAFRQEVITMLSTALSQGIIMAVQELGRFDMHTRRKFFHLLGTSLVLAKLGDNAQPLLHAMFVGDQTTLYESEVAERWAVYHRGNVSALNGLDLWLMDIEAFARELTGPEKIRAYALMSIGYQLQGSLHRDRMEYPQAHDAYKKAFLAADEFGHLEFKSSALARRGVTLIQQQKPIEAIQYLESAITTFEDLNFPCLRGYIYQALSEAHAMTGHKDETQRNIDLAEQVLASKDSVIESSHCDLSTTSVTAQKGVNAVLLKDYRQALVLLNVGIAHYDPQLLRGRARLIAQKAEAFWGLGDIDQSMDAAEAAFKIANTVGSKKTISRITNLYHFIEQSSYRKEKSVSRLGEMLAQN